MTFIRLAATAKTIFAMTGAAEAQKRSAQEPPAGSLGVNECIVIKVRQIGSDFSDADRTHDGSGLKRAA